MRKESHLLPLSLSRASATPFFSHLKRPDRALQKRKTHGHVHVQLRRRAHVHVRHSNKHELDASDDPHRREGLHVDRVVVVVVVVPFCCFGRRQSHPFDAFSVPVQNVRLERVDVLTRDVGPILPLDEHVPAEVDDEHRGKRDGRRRRREVHSSSSSSFFAGGGGTQSRSNFDLNFVRRKKGGNFSRMR